MSALSNLYGFYPIDYDGSPTLPKVDESYFLPPIPDVKQPTIEDESYPLPHRFQPVPIHMVSDYKD
jgi:hypothetical protein